MGAVLDFSRPLQTRLNRPSPQLQCAASPGVCFCLAGCCFFLFSFKTESHSVTQAEFKLTAIPLPQSPKCCDYRCERFSGHCQLKEASAMPPLSAGCSGNQNIIPVPSRSRRPCRPGPVAFHPRSSSIAPSLWSPQPSTRTRMRTGRFPSPLC